MAGIPNANVFPLHKNFEHFSGTNEKAASSPPSLRNTNDITTFQCRRPCTCLNWCWLLKTSESRLNLCRHIKLREFYHRCCSWHTLRHVYLDRVFPQERLSFY